MNGFQYGTPYAGHPIGNIPEFMSLDNSLNIDILQSLRFHCVLSRFLLDREGTDKEERNALQFLYTKVNCQRNEAYMGIKNGNPFFGEDYTNCLSGVESVENCLLPKDDGINEREKLLPFLVASRAWISGW